MSQALEVIKTCIHCHTQKSLTEFKKDKSMKNGRSSMCHDCYRLKYRKPKAEQELIDDLPGEQWALVEELHNNYKISNYGRLLSLNYNREGRTKILLLPKDTRGYFRLAMGFKKDGRINNIAIHRLVGKYFIPNPLNKPEINHIDGVKTNNHYSNLEWCTRAENAQHAFRIGLQSNVGEKHSRASITDLQAKEIKELVKTEKSNKKISELYNTTVGVIEHIRAGDRWTHV